MAGGQKINDYSFFAGSGSPRFPVGNALKEYSSAEGAGKVSMYEDTTEEIKKQQMQGNAKIKAHPMKSNYRN